MRPAEGWAILSGLSALNDPRPWALVGFAVGIYLFVRGFVLLQRKRLVVDTPRSSIRGASLGLIEVCGKADGPYTLISPLAQENCFYYRTVAWQKESSREGSRWNKVTEETLAAPFFLDDSTGQLMVDPREAETELPAAYSDEYTDNFSAATLPEYLRHFLGRHGISFGLPVKLEEYCIRPGDVLFVLGTLQENRGEETQGAEGPGQVGSREFLSAEAADLQRRGALEAMNLPASAMGRFGAVRAETAEKFDLHPRIVLAKATGRGPFLISSRSRREIAESLGWRSALYIWGGPALSLICLWILLANWDAK